MLMASGDAASPPPYGFHDEPIRITCGFHTDSTGTPQGVKQILCNVGGPVPGAETVVKELVSKKTYIKRYTLGA